MTRLSGRLETLMRLHVRAAVHQALMISARLTCQTALNQILYPRVYTAVTRLLGREVCRVVPQRTPEESER